MEDQNKLSVSKLNANFQESKSQLEEHLAETRTNNNLFQGNHFAKKNARLTRALDGAGTSEDNKIRITKNHINTVCKYIINSILHMAPTGVIMPKNPGEIQDQKSAQIHSMVLEDYKIRNKLKAQIRSWVHDFVISGECFVNVFWDDTKGIKIKPSPFIDPLTGAPEVDPATGEMKMNPVSFMGDVAIERIFPWDIRLDPGAKSFDEAEWIGYEKMVSPDVIKKHFGNHPEIDKACSADMDETFKVFEASSGTYRAAKGKVLLRQIYYRPCTDYPNGLYIFFTKQIELARGELPADQNGNVFFPIKYVGFDEVPTSSRSVSIIKQIRPEQMEVNRCASSQALIQMTLGFDKLIVPTGGKVETGATISGTRVIHVPGGKQASDVIQGKSGDQFLGTLQQNISEIYNKTGVPQNWDEKAQDVDIMASLYKNMRQKTRFSLYGEKFTEFLIDIIETILRLKKAYMHDEDFFRVTGGMEYVNIDEFRSLDDLSYQIKVEAGTEDLESRFGKYMALTSTMQYMGDKLDESTRGSVLKNLPFSNGEEIFSQMTMPYENAKNIMLALDRGEMPPISDIGDPLYIATQLNHRMFKPDFSHRSEQIKQNYLMQKQQYNDLYNKQLQTVQRAKEGFIPSDGPTVPVDGMYEVNQEGKTKRVQIPQSTIAWVIEKLKEQGNAFGNIESLPLGQQAEIAQQYMGGNEMPPMNQMDMPMQGMPQL